MIAQKLTSLWACLNPLLCLLFGQFKLILYHHLQVKINSTFLSWQNRVLFTIQLFWTEGRHHNVSEALGRVEDVSDTEVLEQFQRLNCGLKSCQLFYKHVAIVFVKLLLILTSEIRGSNPTIFMYKNSFLYTSIVILIAYLKWLCQH